MPVTHHPDPIRSPKASRFRGFRRDESGATAVEFAIVATPFLALLFAIIETALVFLAGQVLETSVANAGRLVRTGQAQSMDEVAFKQAICNGVVLLSDCETKLHLDVRTYESFAAVQMILPTVDEEGEFVDPEQYEPGEENDIVVVRAFYQWPLLFPTFGIDRADLPNGNRLLAAGATFRNEPFGSTS